METSLKCENMKWDMMQMSEDKVSATGGPQSHELSLYSFYYWDALRWQEVPPSTNKLLSEACSRRKEKIVVSAGEELRYEIDFENKLQKNIKTGYIQSLAWECHSTGSRVGFDTPINVEKQEPVPGQDFAGISFPNFEIHKFQIDDMEHAPTKNESSMMSGTNSLITPKLPSNSFNFESKAAEFFSRLGEKAILLEPESREVSAVKHLFNKGFSSQAAQPRMTAVHKVANSEVKKRAFADQVYEMERSRGDARLKYAWYGASADDVFTVVMYGFSHLSSTMNRGGNVYGSGTYLAPCCKTESSARHAVKDNNKEQHIILCEVILGESEVIPLGSQAYLPSSTSFDSGTDSLLNPSLYVIWSPFCNTHIIPWYIISFFTEELPRQRSSRTLRRLETTRTSPYPPLRVPTRDAKVVEKLFHPSDPRTPSKLQWLNILASPKTPTGVLPPLTSPSVALQRDLNVLSLLSPSSTVSRDAKGESVVLAGSTTSSTAAEEGN